MEYKKRNKEFVKVKELKGKVVEFLFNQPYIAKNKATNDDGKEEEFNSYSIAVNVYADMDAEKPEKTDIRVNLPEALVKYEGGHIGKKNKVKVVENEEGYITFEGPLRKSTPGHFAKTRNLTDEEKNLLFDLVKDANKYMRDHISEMANVTDEEKEVVLSKIRVSFRF